MADNNLFKNLKPDTKLSRNGFDWSGRDVMTFQLGALYPIWHKSMIPNEHVRININHILRTFPMTAPNFNRVRAHFEFFFVPYSQIWKPYHEFYLKRSDRQSVITPVASQSVPTFDVNWFKKYMIDQWRFDESYRNEDVHGYSIQANAFRLLDLLGYGSVLGYENKFAQFIPEGSSYSAIADSLKAAFGSSPEYLNIFKIATYQKIWATYYRDSVHDTTDYSTCYNFDDCVNSGPNDIWQQRGQYGFFEFLRIFEQRYRSYKKDLFTNAYPAQQFGDVSSVSFSALGTNTQFGLAGSDGLIPAAEGAASFEGNYLIDSDGEAVGINVPNAFDVYQFYRAEAVQLWRERVMRAGNRYKDNYKAHFGVVPKFLEDDYPEFIGSFSKLITVEDVTSTAETEQGSLGSLAGKGIAVDQSDNIEYQCNDFGTIMCMFSLVPEMDYNATGYDKDNMAISMEDFIVPEFDRLGLEPITMKEFGACQPAFGNPQQWSPSGDVRDKFNNIILGFNPRFYQHKARVNKVHGRFQYNLGSTYFQNTAASHEQTTKGVYNGDLSIFVQPMQKRINSTSGFLVGDHYINPNVADSQFAVNSDGTESTDRIFGAIQVNCDLIAPLSVSGLHAI